MEYWLTGGSGGAPANDLCGDAIDIDCGDLLTGTTTDATLDNVGFCGTSNTAPGVWYHYAGTDAQVTVSTCNAGSNYDTKLTVFEGSCASLVCVGGNDDNCSAYSGLLSTVEFTSVAGTDYYILVHGYGIGTGDFELSLDCVIPGDLCGDAIVVGEVTDYPFNTSSFTASGANPGCGGSSNPVDMWFEYIPSANGTADFDLCGSSFDTRLAIWDACGGAALYCNDDACGLQSEILGVSVTAGNSYFVQVGGFGTSTGSGDLTIFLTPSGGTNDDCASATVINEVTDLPFSTTAATAGGDNPGCGGISAPVDIWYEYVPTVTGYANFDLYGSNYDTRLAIWDNCGGTALYCNDDAGGYVQSEITDVPVTAGVSVWVQVGGFSTNTGDGDLTIYVQGQSCATAIAANLGVNNASGSPVWYEYTTAYDGYLEISSLGAGVDTRLYVYSDCAGTLVDDDDDWWGYPPGESFVYIDVNAGETYYIFWDDPYSSDPFTFTMVESFFDVTWEGGTDGDWWNAGNWNPTIPGILSDVTIPAGAANYPTMNWYGAVYSLYVESTPTGDGSFIDDGYLFNYNDDQNGNGTTVERYATTDTWHTYSASVAGEVSEIFHFGSGTGYDVYLLEHNEATNAYTYIVPVTYPLDPYKGWFIWGDGANATPPVSEWTYLQNGTLNTGAFGTVDGLTNSGAGLGWNFLGNPYTSALDWASAYGDAATANVDATVYVYDGTNTQWATWNTSTGGTNGGSQYIAMGQGFFVHVTTPGTGTFVVDNADRVHNGVAYMKADVADIVKLQVSNGQYTDETSVLFRMDATEGFDSQYDAYKLFSQEDGVPQIYTFNEVNCAVNVLPEVQSVPVYVAGVNGESQTIQVVENDNFAYLFLEDLFTGEVADLTAGAYTYNFIEGMNQRFVLHFAPLSTPEELIEVAQIYSYLNEVRVAVSSTANAEYISVYNMAGQLINTVSAKAGLNIIPMDTPGNYLVKVVGQTGVMTEKVFIK